MMRASLGILTTVRLAATSPTEQSKPVIKVKVPFDFVACAKPLTAGEYQVRAEWPSLVSLKSRT
jgi:hypothetical protein